MLCSSRILPSTMLCSSRSTTLLCTRCISTTALLMKMPAPKKNKDGPKQAKKAPPPPKITMLQVREKYLEELPPLPYLAYSDERCFLEQYKRPLPNITEEEVEYRLELEKQYAVAMNIYWREVRSKHKKEARLRERALSHLQSADPALYSAAITFNFHIFPGTAAGLRETLPNPQHTAPLQVRLEELENEEAVGTNAWSEIEGEKEQVTAARKQAAARSRGVRESQDSAVKL